jgi:hypothetical protein
VDLIPRLDGRPLIRGLLEREQISVMPGERGCGKTFLALDLGLHIAAGRDWCGRRVTQGPVVYVAAEAGAGIANRVAAWRQESGIAELPFAAVTSPVDLCHADSGDLDRLIAAIRAAYLAADPVLVIIDTVSRVLAGGNENAPDDMGALVRSLDRLRDELHCHVLAVHHVGKDKSRGSRGHSLLSCAVDTEIEVVRDDETGISTATVTKQRDGPTEGSVTFKLRGVELGINDDGDPVTSCVVEPALGTKPVAPKTAPLRGVARVGLDQLRNCMVDHSANIPPSTHVPVGARGVTLDLWRSFLEKAGVINPEGNSREQFKRIRVTLQGHGFIGVWGNFVWLSHAVT